MRLETSAYRAIARLVARSLGSLDGVIGIYTRRSVATGEVAFARSDIDLHILIAASSSPEAEGELLRDLVVRYNRTRRLLPCLGHAWVSTRADLERWYREQPSEWYRDRGWLRLWGEEFDRPGRDSDVRRHDGLLWWYSWAVWSFAESFQRGNARQCYNLVLDMFDAFRLYTGLGDNALPRTELFELWWASGASTRERERIRLARRQGFRTDRDAVLAALYRESLAIHDMLYEHVACQLAGRVTGRLESRVPPLFARRTYVLAEAGDDPSFEAAIDVVRDDPDAWLLNERGLKLYLAYRNPWEYAALAAANPELELAPPSDREFRLSIQRSLFRESPRTFGFMGEPRLTGPLYAQRRLYLDEEFVAAGPGDLNEAYACRYGVAPSTDVSVEEYFLRCYPDACRLIDELRARLSVSASASKV